MTLRISGLKRCFFNLCVCGFCFLPYFAEANLTLPVESEQAPSSVLVSPSQDLTVLHEDLQFDCDAAACKVSATYRITSKNDATFKMTFIGPSNHVGTVSVNDSTISPEAVLVAKAVDYVSPYYEAWHRFKKLSESLEQARKDDKSSVEYANLRADYAKADAEVTRLNEFYRDNFVELFGQEVRLGGMHQGECMLRPDWTQTKGWENYAACLLAHNKVLQSEFYFKTKQQWTLYQFNFEAHLLPGENVVQVSYAQPYSIAEPYKAYFQSPPPFRYVSYELWPLKEWALAPDFKIHLTVRLHNPRYGFLYRNRDGIAVTGSRFKNNRGVQLMRSSNRIPYNTLDVLPDNILLYKTILQGDIADRLFVMTGEEDIINGPHMKFEYINFE